MKEKSNLEVVAEVSKYVDDMIANGKSNTEFGRAIEIHIKKIMGEVFDEWLKEYGSQT